jgi:thiol-disulfide isomerase/thioredoxin
MNRLGLVLMLAVLLTACEQGETPKPVSRRVVAVRSKAPRVRSLAGFCDVVGDRRSARKLVLPRLDRPHSWPPGRARWVNVWATWCKPCIAELPMLAAWRSRLAREGLSFELVFVSADESAQTIADHRRKNPRIPSSQRLGHPDLLPPWIKVLGLDKGAGLPIHIFAAPDGELRCVRAAALSEHHYALVQRLLR